MSKSSSPQPSTSKGTVQDTTPDDYDLTLNIKDEEAEIARLKLPVDDDGDITKEAETKTEASANDERIPKIEFNCSACDMHEMVHYLGKKPPFVYGLNFLEDTFVMRDPFQPPPLRWKPKAEYFIALGANCIQCNRTVCKDAECSFHYTATFCLRCAEQKLNSFPIEVQLKLRKQLAAK